MRVNTGQRVKLGWNSTLKFVHPCLDSDRTNLATWCADECNQKKDFTVLANQRALPVSRNAEKELKNNTEKL